MGKLRMDYLVTEMYYIELTLVRGYSGVRQNWYVRVESNQENIDPDSL